MKIIIEGEPKEIADLILVIQGQLEQKLFTPEGLGGIKSSSVYNPHYHPNQTDVERE